MSANTQNFNIRQGLSVNDIPVIDSNANGSFNTVTVTSLSFANGQSILSTDPLFLAARANTIYTQGVDNAQNTTITAINTFAGGAYNQANTGTTLAQAAFDYANNASTGAVASAYNQANVATELATFANNKANTNSDAITVIQGVNTTQNTNITAANDFAGGAFAAANTNSDAITIIQGVNTTQNTNITAVNNFAGGAFAAANTNADAITVIQGVNTTQNTDITAVNNFAAGAFASANTNANAITVIEGVNVGQNTTITAVNTFAGGAYNQANIALTTAQSAFDYANGAIANAIVGGGSVDSYARSVNDTQNTTISAINSFAGGAYAASNTNSTTITAVNEFAGGAYAAANGKFSSSGGTISGDTVVSGNLIVNGITITANVHYMDVTNNVITLNSSLGSGVAPSHDAYFTVNRGSQLDTSLIWSETNKEWQLTNDGTNTSAITTNSVLQANVSTLNSSISAAYGQANIALTTAQSAFDYANGAIANAITGGGSVDSYARSVNDSQNTSIGIIEGVNTTQNTNISVIQGVDTSQNTRMSIIEGVDLGQNTTITAVNSFAGSAYTAANNALPLAGGTMTGRITANSAISTSTSTGAIVVPSGGGIGVSGNVHASMMKANTLTLSNSTGGVGGSLTFNSDENSIDFTFG